MKVRYVILPVIVMCFLISYLPAFKEEPVEEYEKYSFHEPIVAELKYKMFSTITYPVPHPRKPKPIEENQSMLNSITGLGNKQNIVSESSGSNYGGISIPMVNTSGSPSQIDRLKSKIERIIKRLNQ